MTKLIYKNFYLTENDKKLLYFLWRWKFSTTAAIHDKFFPTHQVISTYNRLLQIQKKGYIEKRHFDRGQAGIIWTLTTNGYKTIKSRIPPVRDTGFSSENLRHDLICNAIHLGMFIGGEPDWITFITEQELRRVDETALPDWVPNPKTHRPDGYWRIDSPTHYTLWALEVELERQNDQVIYDKVLYFRDYRSVDNVLWAIEHSSVLARIQSILKTLPSSRSEIHHFVFVKDFLISGWDSQLQLGKLAGRKIHQVIHPESSDPPVILQRQVTGGSLLDTRACPRNRRELPSFIAPRELRMTPTHGLIEKGIKNEAIV